MIAQRFRALGWVGGIASAATGLYLISLQVAAERAKLEDVDRRITAAQRDMRTLQTELDTRASLRQLERFNSETLALAAPRAKQYLQGDVQLASVRLDNAPPAKAMEAAVATVEAARPQLPAAIPAVVKPARPVPPPVERAAFDVGSFGRTTPRFDHAAFAVVPRLQRVAMIDRIVAVVEPSAAITHVAAHERKARP